MINKVLKYMNENYSYLKDFEINQNVVDEAFKVEVFKATLCHHEFEDDIVRIQRILKSKFNISLTVPEALIFWEHHTKVYFPSWLTMLSNDEHIIVSFKLFIHDRGFYKREKTMVKKLPIIKKKSMKKNYNYEDIEINQNVVDEIFKADLCHHEFKNDIIHIQYALKSKLNISLTVPETILFWEWESSRFCASWLMLSSDDNIVESFQKFVNERYFYKKEKTMVKKLSVTKKKSMKKKKEKEWVKLVENEDGSTSAVFDLDNQKADMIKRLYNVEVITEDILQKLIRDSFSNLERNYQDNLEWPEWKPNDEKQAPEVKKISPKKKTISKKKKTSSK